MSDLSFLLPSAVVFAALRTLFDFLLRISQVRPSKYMRHLRVNMRQQLRHPDRAWLFNVSKAYPLAISKLQFYVCCGVGGGLLGLVGALASAWIISAKNKKSLGFVVEELSWVLSFGTEPLPGIVSVLCVYALSATLCILLVFLTHAVCVRLFSRVMPLVLLALWIVFPLLIYGAIRPVIPATFAEEPQMPALSSFIPFILMIEIIPILHGLRSIVLLEIGRMSRRLRAAALLKMRTRGENPLVLVEKSASYVISVLVAGWVVISRAL